MNFFFSRIVTLSLVIGHLLLFSCNSRNPNLSEKQLLALMNDTTQNPPETPLFVLPDSNYLPPEGAKYEEIRSVDPAAPPEIIDIAGNLNHKKAFKLSDIAESVRYIFLEQPSDTKLSFPYSMTSDDEHIFIDTPEGLFCFSTYGQYLYTVCKNYTEKGEKTGTVFLGNIDLLNGILIARIIVPGKGVQLSFFDVGEMDAQMLLNDHSGELKKSGVKPLYQRQLGRGYAPMHRYLLIDDQSIFTGRLTVTSISGDTLCQFNDYGPYNPQISYTGIYRFNGITTFRKGNNDTIFRVMPPNRLTPAYVMQWPDDLKGKQGTNDGGWIETPQLIFIQYNSLNKEQMKNETQWAIYDKTAKTLTHHITSDQRALIENDMEPVGMPFWPEGVNHKGDMYMVFSKESIRRIIEKGMNRNDKLQAIYDSMPDDSFCIMIVK